MPNELFDKIPDWLKSLWNMENELRRAARNGVILRSETARTHLAAARRHLEQAINEYKGFTPAQDHDLAGQKDDANFSGSPIPDENPELPNRKGS